MGCRVDMWRVLLASLCIFLGRYVNYLTIFFRELSEPQKLLPYLLQPEVNNLTPDIIAVYIQSATKVFGCWASEVAQRWDDEDLPEVKQVVEQIISRMREFATSEHIEVQERV
jgi:AP-3 complex subunit delta-1